MAKQLFIPNGIKNLASQFPGINWANVQDYYVQAIDQDAAVVATSCVNVVIECCEGDIRLHFINYLGTVDSIIFTDVEVESESKSSSYEVTTSFPLVKSKHAVSRFNVSSNETYTVKTVEFEEQELGWIMELLDSPLAWMEWKGIQGQPDDYLAVVVLDKKFPKKKVDDRYMYEAVIEFKLSHEKIILRN